MNGVVVVRERQRQPWVSLEALTQWWVVSGLKGRHAQSLGLGLDLQTTKTARNTKDPERKIVTYENQIAPKNKERSVKPWAFIQALTWWWVMSGSKGITPKLGFSLAVQCN